MNELIQQKIATPTGPRPVVWAAIGAVGALSLALAGVGLSKVMSRNANNTSPAPIAAAQIENAPGLPTSNSAISTAQTAPLATTPAPASKPKAVVQHTSPKVNHSTGSGMSMPTEPRQMAQATNPNLGTVQSVRAIQQKGEGTGAGAVIGGVLGGVLGHQIGGGTGKDLATVGGAVGGGVLGHQIERNVRGKTVYEVTVRMDNGSVRTFTQTTATSVGARVLADGGTLRSA